METRSSRANEWHPLDILMRPGLRTRAAGSTNALVLSVSLPLNGVLLNSNQLYHANQAGS